MKKLDENQQREYLELLNRHKKKLLSYDGVREVAIGYPLKDGVVDYDKISILAFVVKKFPESELQDQQVLPTNLEGVPVDVIEANPKEEVEEVEAEEIYNPLIGGIGISNANLSGRGTLGLIVTEAQSQVLYGLTNWHVIKNNSGKVNDPIVQPAWNPNNDTYRIGNLLRWDRALDCAVFEINQLRDSNTGRLLDIPGTVDGMATPLIGMEVVKSGARTGVTFGVISSITNDLLDITITPNVSKPASGNEISRPGDSGSVWITDDASPRAVALHWGGDGENTPRTEFAYARNIQNISDAMRFSI